MGQGQGQFFGAQRSILGARLLPSAAKSIRSHYQSKVFVCKQGAYTDNSADAVDRLLIYIRKCGDISKYLQHNRYMVGLVHLKSWWGMSDVGFSDHPVTIFLFFLQ